MTYLTSFVILILSIFLLRTKLRLKDSQKEITELKKERHTQSKHLQEKHTFELQGLLNALPFPFFSINSKKHLIRVNQPAFEIFRDREIQNRSISEIFLDPPLIAKINDGLDNLTAIHSTLTLPPNSVFSQNAKGQSSHWEIDLLPLSIQGAENELHLVMRDITPSVRADQVRHDFVANASHELRTPLSIISGYLEHLNEEDGLDNQPMARKMLDTMDRHVIRINRIVEEMLMISKLEASEGTPLKLTEFDLQNCVNDVFEKLDLVITKQDAKVTSAVPPLPIVGDHFYWTQIIFNLVENALKQNATKPVKVKVSAKMADNGHLTIKVMDNGIGIPAEDLSFIFKRFYRVEKHHSQTQIKGTGLGLSLVKRAIEAHGGKIKCTSTPGIRTTFRIDIPPTDHVLTDS